MIGPDAELRARLVAQLHVLPNRGVDEQRVVTGDVEDALNGILEWIEERAASDVAASAAFRRIQNGERHSVDFDANDLQTVAADEVLAGIDAWSSLVTYALTWVYSPLSPPPEGEAGESKRIADRIRKIAKKFQLPLRAAAYVLGADSWSISYEFPLGFSVGLSWNL